MRTNRAKSDDFALFGVYIFNHVFFSRAVAIYLIP